MIIQVGIFVKYIKIPSDEKSWQGIYYISFIIYEHHIQSTLLEVSNFGNDMAIRHSTKFQRHGRMKSKKVSLQTITRSNCLKKPLHPLYLLFDTPLILTAVNESTPFGLILNRPCVVGLFIACGTKFSYWMSSTNNHLGISQAKNISRLIVPLLRCPRSDGISRIPHVKATVAKLKFVDVRQDRHVSFCRTPKVTCK